jgi:hypothetical protein
MGKKDRHEKAPSRDDKKIERASKQEMRKKRAREEAAKDNPDDFHAFERQMEVLWPFKEVVDPIGSWSPHQGHARRW